MKTRSKISLFGGFVAALLFIAGMSLVEPSCEFQGEMLDDMEIAHIAYTAGTIDISYAHLALAFSENPDVREFAHTMIRDHSAVNEKALGLLKKLNATPKDNSTSQQLLAEAEKFKKELAELDGEAFDKRYAENDLGYHQFANETLDTWACIDSSQPWCGRIKISCHTQPPQLILHGICQIFKRER